MNAGGEMQNENILWSLYEEHCKWERHHEEQRASVTNALVLVAAGVLSVVTFGGLTQADLPLTAFLMVQGLFGAIVVEKQYERFARHQRLANCYRIAIDSQCPELGVDRIREEAEAEHKRRFPIMGRTRLHWLWTCLQLLIAAFGGVLTYVVLCSPST